MQPGILYGISVGTGDPELITLKGLRLLQQAPVVAFPAGVDKKPGIAQQIVSGWLKPEQQTLSLHFPYVRDERLLLSAWQEAARQVWQYLQQGQDVAFACEGDVSFFSTFTYLAQTLQQLYSEAIVETVPGVCSPMAAASALKIPLTIRDRSLVILPAIYSLKELKTVLDWADVVVLLKVSSVYRQVWQVLRERNLLQSSWIIERASFPDQVIYSNLNHYPQLKLSYFSLLLIQVIDNQQSMINADF
ncbi:precorrin-2 C(20)-methyltransferase [Pleurocapsales cyanobacterium LEGE 06147]|nr:precorrin-2 C(20)-methyltransferase [Pleurocapsales cyanobacterium LEGE 06147]